MFHSNAFKHDALIFHPPTQKWRTSSECVWEAKRGFATRFILADAYPDQQHLFHECLKIPNADADMVLQLIVDISRRNIVRDASAVSRLKLLLLALSCHLAELPDFEGQRKIQKLEEQHIIPVCRMENGVRTTKLMRLDWDFWFYADSKRHFEAFSDTEVWLADFPYSQWYDMQHLYVAGSKVFRRRERRLSKAAKETKALRKGLELNEYWTNVLASKGVFLRRYDKCSPA